MNTPNTSSKTLPFNTDQLLKAVDDSGKRSRNILLLLTFSSFLIGMALVNSLVPKYNWFKSKIEISKDILKYVVFPSEVLTDTEKKSTKYEPLAKFSEYIIANEKYYSDTPQSVVTQMALDLDSKYPLQRNYRIQNPQLVPVLYDSYSERTEKYREIGKSFDFMYKHNISEKPSLVNTITKLDDAQVEHLDLIRVPILGISFHVNYLGAYSGLLLTILHMLFYFSLMREKINLKITFKRGWIDLKHHHYYLYEYVSMLQVLSIPKKLFTHRGNRNLTYLLFSKCAIYLPVVTYASLSFYDLSTVPIGIETNARMTILTVSLDFIFLITILIYSYKVSKQWAYLDILWDNQAYEFNLEYIFEAIGEDKEVDLIDLFPPRISKDNLNDVKRLWYTIVMESPKKKKGISISRSEKMLSQFVTRTFKKDFEPIDSSVTYEQIDEVWAPFKTWFNLKGKKNVNSNFRSTFCEMVNGITREIQVAVPVLV